MRYLILILLMVSPALAVTPIHNIHDEAKKVDDEFRNVFYGFQPIQFTLFSTTPNVTDLQDRQMVIFSSGGVVSLQLRLGTTNYQVRFSTIQGK